MELSILVPRGVEWAGVLVSYLLGSTAFGLVLGLVLRGVDIRKAGSGNVGATNAGRVLGRPFGLAAFAGDFLKGWVPSAWLGPALALAPERAGALAVWCGGAAVVGHVWPLWFGFRGGKAVATGCGAVLGRDPVVFLLGGAVWLVVAGLSRMVSLASLSMAFAFPFFAWWRASPEDGGAELVWGTAALALLVLWRHRANLRRIASGKEPRIGRRAPADGETSGSGSS